MAKKVTTQTEVEQIRRNLEDAHQQLSTFVYQIGEDHNTLRVCEGYSDFQKDSPIAYLERATAKLARKDYKVAFAGPFKAGKSTFLSALLKQPGMLPAEDAECTFSVGVIAAPGPGEEERVEVTYYGADEILGNMLTHLRYGRLFEGHVDERDKLKVNPQEAVVITFLLKCAEEGYTAGFGEEAEEIKDFVEAYRKFKNRLGGTHIDGLANLPTYVRKEEGIGHLLLIKIVHIFMNNPVLAKQGFHIADTPGTDSMNLAAREITFNYLKEADAVIYLAEARGLSLNFAAIRDQLSKYHNSIRDKMFIVANKADWYEVKSMRKEGGQKAPIEVVYESIVNPLRALGLNETKLYFTAGRMSELEQKKSSGTMTPEEEAQYGTMRQALNDKIAALSPDINPLLLKRLQTAFKDGGVDDFREVLIDYLDIDIQVERLKDIYTDLNRIYASAKTMLEPERTRLQSAMANMKTSGMMVTEFFDEVRGVFADKASGISRAMDTIAPKIMDQVKKQIQSSFTKGIDRFNVERIRVHMPVQVPVKIKMEVIEQLKGSLSERFIQVVREGLTPPVKTKLHQEIESGKIVEVLRALSGQLNTKHAFELESILDEFDRAIDQFTSMRASEETWELQAAVIKPDAYDAQWTPQVEQKFREQLKKLFVDRYVAYATKIGNVIGRHFQVLLSDLTNRFDHLIDEVAREVKKDPDRVKLPVEMLGAGTAETDEEKKARAIVNYFKFMDAAQRPMTEAQGYLM